MNSEVPMWAAYLFFDTVGTMYVDGRTVRSVAVVNTV